MVDHSDGFELAEYDLRLRGPGEFLGTRQHGLPPFVHADPVRDYSLLLVAREEAERLLQEDPRLSGHDKSPLVTAIQRRFRKFFQLVLSG